MHRALLAKELAKNPIDTSAIAEICKQNPVGYISDKKKRLRFWSILLLGLDLKGEGDQLQFVECNEDIPKPPEKAIRKQSMSKDDERVLDADVKRTRGYLPMFQDPETQKIIKNVLFDYCNTWDMRYKQGLHELVAPFVALSDPPPPSPVINRLFHSFLMRYIGPFFEDEEFVVLQMAFRLFNVLLIFHDPALGQHLLECDFPPALYATPWILTLFSHNLEMHLVHRLWDVYIAVNNPSMIYFLCVGLLLQKRDILLESDIGQLFETISQIRISSTDEIQELFVFALDLYSKTPMIFIEDLKLTTESNDGIIKSFSQSSKKQDRLISCENTESEARDLPVTTASTNDNSSGNNLETSKLNDSRFNDERYVWHAREGVRCIEISVNELIDSLGAPSVDTASESEQTANNKFLAINEPSKRKYVILDIRSIEEYETYGCGEIAKSMRLNPLTILQRPDLLDIWIQHFDGTKGCHICIIGSGFNQNYGYLDWDDETEDTRGSKIWKRLVFGDGDGKSIRRPFEDSAAIALATVLQEKGFPYVGLLKGSFENIIEVLISQKRSLEPIIINHDPVVFNRRRETEKMRAAVSINEQRGGVMGTGFLDRFDKMLSKYSIRNIKSSTDNNENEDDFSYVLPEEYKLGLLYAIDRGHVHMAKQLRKKLGLREIAVDVPTTLNDNANSTGEEIKSSNN